MELIKLAPTAFPCLQGVRNAILDLNEQHNLLDCEPRFSFMVASEVADVWRVMLKDVYD